MIDIEKDGESELPVAVGWPLQTQVFQLMTFFRRSLLAIILLLGASIGATGIAAQPAGLTFIAGDRFELRQLRLLSGYDSVRESRAIVEWIEASQHRETSAARRAVEERGLDASSLASGCYQDVDCEIAVQGRLLLADLGGYRTFEQCLAETLPKFDGFREAVDIVAGEISYQWPTMPQHVEAAQFLASRYRDQAFRLAAGPSSRLMRATSSRCQSTLAFLLRVESELADRRNARLIEQSIRTGWPRISVVGREASQAAFLIAQHASHDPALQVSALRAMEPLLATGDVAPRNYAYLSDRVGMALSGRQRFGTQFTCVNGVISPAPLEAASRVDTSRQEIGLEPLNVYLERSQPQCDRASTSTTVGR